MLGLVAYLHEMGHRLLFHACITMQELFVAGVLGGGFAVLCALGMHYSSFFRRVLEGVLVLVQGVPLFILSPLLILAFGFSQIAVVLPTALMLIFPLAIAFHKGSLAAPQQLVIYYLTMGYTRLQILWAIRLPYALPALFSGLRVAVSHATLGILASEWAGGQAGLGVFLQEMRRNYDLYGVLTGTVCAFGISFLLYGGLVCIEQWCMRRYSHSSAA